VCGVALSLANAEFIAESEIKIFVCTPRACCLFSDCFVISQYLLSGVVVVVRAATALSRANSSLYFSALSFIRSQFTACGFIKFRNFTGAF
jgi:hypothetical protein